MFISGSNHNPTPITATTSKPPPSSLDFSDDDHHNDMLIEVGPTHHRHRPHHHQIHEPHRLPSVGTTPSSSGPKKRAETWVQDETRNLISLRREMDSLFNSSKSKKHLREQISAKMRDRGFDRSPTMCTDNWRNLLKEFKKAKQEMGNAGNGNAKMLCYKEIEEILRDRSRCASNSAGYKSPNHNSNDGVNHSSKVDSFLQFSDKGIDDASIPFGPIEGKGRPTLNLERCLDHKGLPLAITAADGVTDGGCPPSLWRETPGNANGRPTLNLERRLDHEGLPLAITAADGVTDRGCPPSFWRDTPGNGDDTHPFGGRVITFKFGDYTKRIGVEGTACTLDPAKFGAANDSIDRGDNHVMSIEVAADIYEAPCTLEVSKFGTSNSILDRDDDNHGKSTEAAANTDTISAAPHPALSYVLAFLGVRDLLSVERVCKSLCHTVRNDPILWRNIHIDNPLHEKITDDILLQLTNRAQGSLHCLNLMNCQRISDDGLKRVLLSNPRMTKLSVPGCTRLSNDGVVNCLRAFKMVAVNGIKFLRFGGRVGVTQKHFEELMSLLDTGNQVKNNRPKPHFYHRGKLNISYEDDRPIDLEMCPRCQNMRLVYDCPADSCQGKNHAAESCKACTLCIARCYECGKCINDDCVYEETFSLDSLCSDCWNHVPHCPDVGIILPQHVIDQEPSAFSFSHG